MKIRASINIKPFVVPDAVVVDDHLSTSPVFLPLTKLSNRSLHELCSQFMCDVFAERARQLKALK